MKTQWITTKKPHFHIHVDGKKGENEKFANFAKSIGFEEAPFYRDSQHAPVLHLTKKYGLERKEFARKDFETLKAHCKPLQYKGYLEFEEIYRRYEIITDAAEESNISIPPPFLFTHRQLEPSHKEFFKAADIHLTIDNASDKNFINALHASNLLVVRPVYANSLVFTAQFPHNKHHKIDLYEQRFLEFLRSHQNLISKAVLKIEKMIDYHVSEVDEQHLPLVLNRCKYCPLQGWC